MAGWIAQPAEQARSAANEKVVWGYVGACARGAGILAIPGALVAEGGGTVVAGGCGIGLEMHYIGQGHPQAEQKLENVVNGNDTREWIQSIFEWDY